MAMPNPTFPDLSLTVQTQNDSREEETQRRAWFEAADAGDIAAMAILLTQQPALIDATTRLQQGMNSLVSALQICVWHNHSEAAAWLLDVGGASLELQDDHGLTALLVDLMRVGVELMRSSPLLRSCWIDVSSPVEVARYKRKFVKDRSAFEQMDTRTLEVLLARHANVNHCSKIGETALLLAVEEGLIKQVRILLDHGVDLHHRDAAGRTVLEVAGEYGYVDVAELLIARAPDLVSIAGEKAIREAVCYDFVGILELLIPQVVQSLCEASYTRLCGQLLHMTVEYDAPDCLRFLLANGVLIDWRDPKDGRTALHVASVHRRTAILTLLLENGASPDLCSEDSEGFSPFHLALQHRGLDQIDVLAQHQADINLHDRRQRTPLLFAALSGHSFDTMQQLVTRGASFTFPTSSSRYQSAAVLTTWLHSVEPAGIPHLVETILNASDCGVRDRYRRVISALLWAGHSAEALQLVLLMLFSPRRRPALLALRIILPWAIQNEAHPIVLTLLNESLDWRIERNW